MVVTSLCEVVRLDQFVFLILGVVATNYLSMSLRLFPF